jgi:hypothetical protein
MLNRPPPRRPRPRSTRSWVTSRPAWWREPHRRPTYGPGSSSSSSRTAPTHPAFEVMSINVLRAIGSMLAGQTKKPAPPVRFARWLSLARLAAAFAAAVAVAAGLLARCDPPPPLPPPTPPPEIFDVVVFSILLLVGVVLVVTGLALRRSERKARFRRVGTALWRHQATYREWA